MGHPGLGTVDLPCTPIELRRIWHSRKAATAHRDGEGAGRGTFWEAAFAASKSYRIHRCSKIASLKLLNNSILGLVVE